MSESVTRSPIELSAGQLKKRNYSGCDPPKNMDHDNSFLCVLLKVVSDLANVVSPMVEGGHQGVKDARSAEDF